MQSDVLRFLRPRDALLLMHLRHRAIRESPTAFGTPADVEVHRSAAYYRRQLLSMDWGGHGAWLGLWQEEKLLGVAGLRQKNEQNQTYGLIFSMFVEAEARCSGRGKRLLLAARAHLREQWKLPECRLCVETANTGALRLYERCGFHVLRREPNAFVIDGLPHDVWLLSDRDLGAQQPTKADAEQTP
jgi:ribosomal protein S18 acetylase RimI-like enzyme